MNRREEQIVKGRMILTGVTSSYATFLLMSQVYAVQRLATVTSVVTFAVQTLLTVVLFYAMWTGRSWARWTTSALLGVALILVIATMVRDFNWRLALFAAYVGALPIALCFPDAVDAFIDDQRRKRTEPKRSSSPANLSDTPPASQEQR